MSFVGFGVISDVGYKESVTLRVDLSFWSDNVNLGKG